MLFNVLAHNKDDHSKNFAYLFDPLEGRWKLAPAYDLTFNTGMANNHTTSINGSGNPSFADLKKVASERKIARWLEILEDVRQAVSRWPEFADQYGINKKRVNQIQKELSAIDRVTRQ